MATTCPHGFPPDGCLICETLAASRQGAAPPAVAGAPLPSRASSTGTGPAATGPAPERKSSPLRRLSTTSVVLVIGAVVLVLGVGWAVAGLVFAVLRVLELVVAVAVAGWVGHRVGLAQGRREGRGGRNGDRRDG